MRILVHEFVSGGGLAGRPVTASLAREGSAMLAALVADLSAIGRHQIVTTVDPRFPLRRLPGAEVLTLFPEQRDDLLEALIGSVDAVWPIAPETDRCLERLAARAERNGKVLLGSGSAAIRRASDKANLPWRLGRHGVRHPKTCVLRAGAEWRAAAEAVGFPLVVKPARGAGCCGVILARSPEALVGALEWDHRTAKGESLLLQEYVPGVAASVSLLSDGRDAVPLAVNGQSVRTSPAFSYHGGQTPINHPLANRAAAAALHTCRALPGLRGFVGVDLVLTGSEAVVIEVNPRLTTAYLGVRLALDENVAALALAACLGSLPTPPPIRRSIRFTAAGRIRCAEIALA
jgi:predicted ATP-grasp superfamily ATP-dependent carboligase